MYCKEWVPAPAPKVETAGESGDVEKSAATDGASTLESRKTENRGGSYSTLYLTKSTSLSGSKCIGVQSKTSIYVS